jgi:hypothetical protein
MVKQSTPESPNYTEAYLHLANPNLASYDYGAAVAAAALHALPSESLQISVEKLPLALDKQISEVGELMEAARSTRIL